MQMQSDSHGNFRWNIDTFMHFMNNLLLYSVFGPF